MKWFVIFVSLALGAMVMPAWAETTSSVDIGGTNYALTPTQLAQIAVEAAKNQAINTAPIVAPSVPSAQTVSQYVGIGQQIGEGLAATAKSLGVAVNEFSKTPIGILATIVIVYDLIGRDFVQYIFGAAFFLGAISMWFYMFRRMCIVKSITVSTDDNGRPVKVCEHYDQGSVDATRCWLCIFLLVLIGIGYIITFVS